ncbi:Glutathione S-transferase 3 [Fusarium oxysporum f. sp. conglutinans]|nr:Glutathione S-transferase 3 [Fusarium oxysporum f. sp. conglutinans]
MDTKASDITLYFLNGSRAIRVAWLLEELGLSYKLVTSPRGANGHAPLEFKAQIPTRLGNSPTIQDGDLVIQESIAIMGYLCETYSTSSRLFPSEPLARAKVREWMAAAEGTFMLYALTVGNPLS